MITIVEDPNFISSSHLIYDLWQQKKDVTAETTEPKTR